MFASQAPSFLFPFSLSRFLFFLSIDYPCLFMFLHLAFSSILTFPFIIFRMVSRRMCEGLVDSFGGEIYYVIKETNQSPEEMCGFMFGEACNKPYSDK